MDKPHYHVVAAIIRNDGDILCMQRPKGKHEYTSFRWEFPGGKVEPGESEQQALKRELQEEMDYTVEIREHYMTLTHDYPDITVTLSFWLCDAASRTFNRKEHLDHRWLRPDQLPTLQWTDADADVIEKLAGDGKPEA